MSRGFKIVITLVAIFFAFIFTSGFIATVAIEDSGKSSDPTSGISTVGIAVYTNRERSKGNVKPLIRNSLLDKAASLKCADMVKNNYWAHVSPSGVEPWYWFTKAGYTYDEAAENLANELPTSKDVVSAWMSSPGHRTNLMDKDYSEVGYAICEYNTNYVHTGKIIVQELAKPYN